MRCIKRGMAIVKNGRCPFFMYSAFQVIDPFLETGMSFKKEYEMAREMREKGK